MNRRRSIRLKDYDYSQPGAYFVTICTRNRERVLGEIVGGTVTLSPVVDLVQTTWLAIRHNYPGVDVDEFIVMPSHLHGIILLTGATDLGKADQDQGEAIGQARGPGPTSPLPDVVHRFKSLTTARYPQMMPFFSYSAMRAFTSSSAIPNSLAKFSGVSNALSRSSLSSSSIPHPTDY